jgi:hypothetical protein
MHDKIRRSYQGNEMPFFSLVSEKLGIFKSPFYERPLIDNDNDII